MLKELEGLGDDRQDHQGDDDHSGLNAGANGRGGRRPVVRFVADVLVCLRRGQRSHPGHGGMISGGLN